MKEKLLRIELSHSLNDGCDGWNYLIHVVPQLSRHSALSRIFLTVVTPAAVVASGVGSDDRFLHPIDFFLTSSTSTPFWCCSFITTCTLELHVLWEIPNSQSNKIHSHQMLFTLYGKMFSFLWKWGRGKRMPSEVSYTFFYKKPRDLFGLLSYLESIPIEPSNFLLDCLIFLDC